MTMRQKLIVRLVLVMACLGWGWLCYRFLYPSEAVTTAGGELLRFHVIANGDSAAEQAVKLKVRDAVLARLANELAGAESAEEAKQIALRRQEEIVSVAEGVLCEAGEQDKVRMEVGRFDFPVRMYGDVLVPAGEYEAVRLVIGEGKGKNWWCVLFPPLCVVDVSVVTSEAVEQTEEDRRVIYRSKLAEILGG